MVMAVVVTVIVVTLLSEDICNFVVMINISIVVMVVIVIMKNGCRRLMVQMTMHALYRRPGELEGGDQHEEDGKHTTHQIIVPKNDYGLGIGCRTMPVSGDSR
jgi:hypothetical protein